MFGMLFLFENAGANSPWLVIGLVGYGFVMFCILLIMQHHKVMHLQNIITLFRLGAGGGVLCWMSARPELTLYKFCILSAAALTDVVDGIIARRRGSTDFGAKLDMEVDAFFTLFLSVNGFVFARMGAWILAVGLMRYGYEFILLLLPEVEKFPTFVKYGEKTICAFTVIALISITAPFFPYTGKLLLGYSALVLLGFSFLMNMSVRIFTPCIKH
jgi:phosphatidylglycerophosphate synthase